MSLAINKLLDTSLPRQGWEFLDHHPLPTWVVQADDFLILYGNISASRLYGSPQDNFLNYFPEESRLRFLQQMRVAGKEPVSEIYAHQRTDGQKLWVSLHAHPVPERNWLQISVFDITNTKSEIAFLEDEIRRYQTFVEQSSEGIYCQEFPEPVPVNASPEELLARSRTSSYISECNEAMARMYGYESAREMKGLLGAQLLDYDDPANLEYLRGFIQNGFRVVNAESVERDRYGNTKYFLNSAFGIVEDGFLRRVWGMQQDITERKKIHEQLSLMANLVEQTTDVLTAADINFIPVTWNKAAERIYGLKAEDVIGRNLREFIEIDYMGFTREEVRAEISAQGGWRGETMFVRPTDGKRITLLLSYKQLLDGRGQPLGYLISATDITERKEIEQRVAESEHRFREMTNSVPVMIWICDQDNNTTYVSQKWLEYTGSDIIGVENGWASLVHPEDIFQAKRLYDRAFAEQKPVTLTYRLRRIDGSYSWVQDVGVPRFLEDGTFVGFIGSVVDIEQQKQREAQLRYQATVLENVSDIIVSTDLQFCVRGWNKAAENVYGLSEAEATGRKFLEIVNMQFESMSRNSALTVLLEKGAWEGEVSVDMGKGERRFFLQTVRYVLDERGQKIGFMAVGRDISERKKFEAELQKSEQFYRTLIADSLDATLLLNADGHITYSSPALKNVLGYENFEVLGRSGFEFVHPDDALWALESFNKEKEANPEVKNITVRLLTRDKTWVWCSVRGHNLLKHAAIGSIVVYIHDDTLRKKASDALKESERRFRELVRDIRLGVVIYDAQGKITLCNNAACSLLGLSEPEVMGKTVVNTAWDVIHEDGARFVEAEFPVTVSLSTGLPVRDVVMGVYSTQMEDRNWLLVNAEPIHDEQEQLIHVICSFTDITERKKLERKLLADQIAHQRQLTQATIDGQEKERREIGRELHDNIGQQLTSIKLFLELARSTTDDSTGEMIAMAQKSVSGMINEVRAMSRSLVPQTLSDLGLVDSISELAESLGRMQVLDIEFDASHYVNRSLPDNQKLMVFRIVQEQLNNVVKHAGAGRAKILLQSEGTETVLEVSDDGCGFDPATVRQGLGFKNIKNRAELFGGTAIVDAAPGKGCRLLVRFPQIQGN